MYKLILIIITFIGFGCGHVRLKFHNDSKEDFKKLVVNISGKQYSFENLKSGETTKPINVAETYDYCYAEVITSRDTLIHQPIDFVGERLHKWGWLTMHLTISGNSNDKNRSLMIER